jgi:hypothetical protein
MAAPPARVAFTTMIISKYPPLVILEKRQAEMTEVELARRVLIMALC